MCTSLTLFCFAFYEIGLTLFYKWVKREYLEMTTWVILGSKVLKLFIATACMVFVRFFTHESIVGYALILLGIILITVIYETTFFLLSGKKKDKIINEKNYN